MALTACGNDGGTKKIGVFAGIKTANKAVGTLSASPAKMRVKELAKLVNDMDYEEIDMDEIPEEVISKYSFKFLLLDSTAIFNKSENIIFFLCIGVALFNDGIFPIASCPSNLVVSLPTKFG